MWIGNRSLKSPSVLDIVELGVDNQGDSCLNRSTPTLSVIQQDTLCHPSLVQHAKDSVPT